MVRAPCCEKMGLKKGPWTAQEDRVLVDYISRYGHGNWRALPKQAGLLRCGKSCRLRWTNYLRPDIKRGNFTRDEEETIIQLHQALGNRWSAIAARLPGRTDNEIKNVWHTHLKKRLNLEQINQGTTKTQCTTKSEPVTVADSQPHNRSCSEVSSSSTVGNSSPETEDDFWSEVLSSAENYTSSMVEPSVTYGNMSEGMEFWFEVFTRSAEDLLLLPESPEI